MAGFLFIKRLSFRLICIFFFMILSKSGIGQMTQSQKAIDSTIEANRNRYIKSANCIFYFTRSAWGGEKLYIVNLQLKVYQ
jgi:hypothetical protein